MAQFNNEYLEMGNELLLKGLMDEIKRSEKKTMVGSGLLLEAVHKPRRICTTIDVVS